MTDAERIAEYMLKREAMREPFTAADVTRLATNNPGGQCGMLIAMLSDVRREERETATERCLDILVRVGIAAMEAGHTSVGKYIAAASTQIRGSL